MSAIIEQGKLTDWFHRRQRPARPGVYQVRGTSGSEFSWIGREACRYAHWNGRHWSSTGCSVRDVAQRCFATYGYQMLDWRGLAEEPKNVAANC